MVCFVEKVRRDESGTRGRDGGQDERRGQGINLKNMEGIANFIIPMLKNQTVNTNPHMFQLLKLQTHKHEPLFQLSFEPTNKYTRLHSGTASHVPKHLTSTSTASTSRPPFSSPAMRYFLPHLEILPGKRQFRAPKVRGEDSKCPGKIYNSRNCSLTPKSFQSKPT